MAEDQEGAAEQRLSLDMTMSLDRLGAQLLPAVVYCPDGEPVLDVSDMEPAGKIGKGSYGVVELWRHTPSGKRYCVKSVNVLSLGEHEQALAVQELNLMRCLRHPHMVECRQAWSVSGQLALLLTYCPGGTLGSKLCAAGGPVANVDDIPRWLCQTLAALRFLHASSVIHRDVCAENIFLSGDHRDVFLGDFGACRVVEQPGGTAATPWGHLKYLSPEMIQGKQFSAKTDAWSLGIILWRLLKTDTPGAMVPREVFKAQLKLLRDSLPEMSTVMPSSASDVDTIEFLKDLCTVIEGFVHWSLGRRLSIANACGLECVQRWWPLDLARGDASVEHTLYQTSVRQGAVLHTGASGEALCEESSASE